MVYTSIYKDALSSFIEREIPTSKTTRTGLMTQQLFSALLQFTKGLLVNQDKNCSFG